MKIKIFAVSVLIAVVGFTVFDTLLLQKQLTALGEKALALDVSENNSNALTDAEALRGDFAKKEGFISLTVNHEDLTNIEAAFTDLIGELSVGNHEDAEVAKNRLADALGHLRRLSGFNIDSII